MCIQENLKLKHFEKEAKNCNLKEELFPKIYFLWLKSYNVYNLVSLFFSLKIMQKLFYMLNCL